MDYLEGKLDSHYLGVMQSIIRNIAILIEQLEKIF